MAFFDYLPLSIAAGHKDGTLSHLAINWQYLPLLFMPHIFGFMFKDLQYFFAWCTLGGYFTLSAVFVGLSGLAFKSYRAVKLFLVIWIMLCVSKAYGFLQLNFLFDFIPFKYIIFSRYYNATAEFALSFLVALSLQDISKKSVNRYLVVFLLLSLLLLFSLGVIANNVRASAVNKETTYYLISITFTLLSILFAFVLIAKNKLQLVKLLVVTETVIYFIAPLAYVSHDIKHQHLALGGIRYLEKNLGLQRFYAINRIAPNYGSYFGLSQINYIDVPIPQNWVSYVIHSLDPYVDQLSYGLLAGHANSQPDALSVFMKNIMNFEEMGVKYLVIDNKQNVSLPRVYQDKRLAIYALPNPKPYFEIIKGSCKLNSNSKTELTADCLQRSTLLRRELYMPGWRATVNNHGKTVRGYQGLLQIVHLPEGKSHISFSFLPPYEEYVQIIFLLAMVMLCWPAKFRRGS